MFWNISTFASIITTVIYGAILTLVVLSKPRNRLREIFGVYLLAMVIWSVSAFFTTIGIVQVLPWFRIWVASPIAMSVAIFYFIQSLFGQRRKWAPLILIYGILAVTTTLFTDRVIRWAILDPAGQLHFELGPIVGIIAAPGYMLIIFSMIELIRGYYHTHDANQRNRIRYLTMGLLITIISSSLNLTSLAKYPIDLISNGITAILIAYAILRHQLLDIPAMIRLGLLYSVITTIFAGFYYLAISFALHLFKMITGKEIFIVSVLVGTLTAVILTPLWTQAKIWIDRLFYREKYDAGLMLQRLTHTAASFLDLNELTDLILSEIVTTLHIVHAAILIKSPSSGDFQMIATQGELEKNILDFSADHPIVTWMAKQNKVLSKNDLAIIPIFKSLWGQEKEQLERFQVELFIPIIKKGTLVGLLILGPRRSAQAYNKDDLQFFSTLADQTAVAIENARLYDDLEDTFVQTVIALANAIDVRDTYTSAHSQWIAKWAVETAQYLGCTHEEVEEIRWGGLLHDIGKIGVPDHILNKPGKLEPSEWEIIHRHPILGAELVSPIKKLENVAPLIKHSHERYDGSGYPSGLTGEQIPLGARIISVVDSYSAMRDIRVYKRSYSAEEATEELKRYSGKMYDLKVVEAFLYILEIKGDH